jgi:DNA primase
MSAPGPRVRWQIADVLDRTDLAQILDEIAQPATHSTRGRRWHCPLPEHEDHHASVTMHTDHRGHERWRCWSGDDTHRGDAIDLISVTQRVSRADAIDWLAQRAGMVPDRPLPAPARKRQPRRPTHVPLDPAVVKYAKACERILWGSGGLPVREWLHGRGFSDELIAANHIGADPGRRKMRRRRGLPYGNSIAAVFPALDPEGRIRYLQARYIEPGDGPKYDNPAAALGSNPRLAWTRTLGRARPNALVVCEGIPDALTAAQAGLRSVGVLGSQAPDESVANRLAAIAARDDVLLTAIVDNDEAGVAWGERLSALLTDHGQTLAVVEPPEPGLDLNSWAAKEDGWHQQLPCLREGPAKLLTREVRDALDVHTPV